MRKSLLIFSFIFILILCSASSSVALFPAEVSPTSTIAVPFSAANTGVGNAFHQNFGIEVMNNSTYPYTPFQEVLYFALETNDTVNGIPALTGAAYYQFSWSFGPGGGISALQDNIYIEVRDSTGILKTGWDLTEGLLFLSNVSGTMNVSLNLTKTQYHFDLYAVPYGSQPSWSDLWWGVQLNPLIIVTHTVYSNHTVYHNVTKNVSYIPPIIYVIIAVLMGSVIALGVRGSEDESSMKRMKRRRF